MTVSDYWDGRPDLCRAFRKKREIEEDRENINAWIQGAYFHSAICSAMSGLGGKPIPYTDQPFPLRNDGKANMKRREKDLALAAARFAEFAKKHNARNKHE